MNCEPFTLQYGYDSQGCLVASPIEGGYPIFIDSRKCPWKGCAVDDGDGNMLNWDELLDWPDMRDFIIKHRHEFKTLTHLRNEQEYLSIQKRCTLKHVSKTNNPPTQREGLIVEPHIGRYGHGYRVILPGEASALGRAEYWILKD